MHIRTIEEDYDYRLKDIMEKFLSRFEELNELDADELQDKMWEENYAKEFAHIVMEDMTEYSGEELFETSK